MAWNDFLQYGKGLYQQGQNWLTGNNLTSQNPAVRNAMTQDTNNPFDPNAVISDSGGIHQGAGPIPFSDLSYQDTEGRHPPLSHSGLRSIMPHDVGNWRNEMNPNLVDWSAPYQPDRPFPHGGFEEMQFDERSQQPKRNIKDIVSGGLTSIKKGGKKLMTPLMMMAQSVNPLSPTSSNFNPMLEGQIENYTAQGWRVNDQGQAIDGPLAGQNLVSVGGTNDPTAMLRKRLQKIRTRKIAQTTSSRAKQKEILDAINAQKAAENKGYTGTPGGNVGSGAFAKFDQSGKTYGPFTPQGGNQGNKSGNYGAAQGTKGSWNPGARKDGGRIGYNRGRVVNPGGYAGEEEFEDENILEFMRDQNVPHSEMVEGEDFLLREEYNKYLFEMDELDLEPMSFEDFKAQAMMAEGQEDSFDDRGIASLV